MKEVQIKPIVSRWDTMHTNLQEIQRKKKAKEELRKAFKKKFEFAKYGAENTKKKFKLTEVIFK